jgi:ABC-type multidrug transport system fused ATPase/permease subunit
MLFSLFLPISLLPFPCSQVGPSGAGKSTLAALLNRFYLPSSGSLLVDGVAITALSRDEYLERVSVVRQAPALFTDTVANNIGDRFAIL